MLNLSFDGRTVKSLLLYRHYIAGFLISLLIRLQTFHLKVQPIDLCNIKRILIIRNEPRIGDFILMSAFLRETRQLFSEAEIHLVVCSPRGRWPNDVPMSIGLSFLIAADDAHSLALSLNTSVASLSLARCELRPIGFDLAIVPRWDVDSHAATALAYFSGRVGDLLFRKL